MTHDIVLICDDNYTLPTAVCINSIIRNCKIATGLNIHICSFSLTEENQKLLQDCGNSKFKVSISLLDYSKYENILSNISAKSHVSKAALIKFELPNIFDNLDNLLYLDSDIIIKDSLEELLNTDLGDNYMAASYEFWKEVNQNKYEFFKYKKEFFFNSGVMLMNLQLMRVDNITEKLWDFKINRATTTLMDQESFNAICASRTIQLSIKWNYNPIFTNDSFVAKINRRYKESYLTKFDMFNDVRIIHYVGKADKPWLYKNARHRSFWDECYDKDVVGLIDLKTYENKKSLITRIKEIYNLYGIMGFFSFATFKIVSALGLDR